MKLNVNHKRRGALGVVFGVVTVVVLGIVLILGALVFFAFSNSLPTGLVTGAQNSTLNSIVGTGSSAIALMEVILIVAAAGLIIAAVFAYMAIGRRKLRDLSPTIQRAFAWAVSVWTAAGLKLPAFPQ